MAAIPEYSRFSPRSRTCSSSSSSLAAPFVALKTELGRGTAGYLRVRLLRRDMRVLRETFPRLLSILWSLMARS
jgi:hypothetical protein